MTALVANLAETVDLFFWIAFFVLLACSIPFFAFMFWYGRRYGPAARVQRQIDTGQVRRATVGEDEDYQTRFERDFAERYARARAAVVAEAERRIAEARRRGSHD